MKKITKLFVIFILLHNSIALGKKVPPKADGLYSPGAMMLRVSCLEEFDYYELTPFSTLGFDNNRLFASAGITPDSNNVQPLIDKLKKKRIYKNLSTVKGVYTLPEYYVRQEDICKLPSGTIRTEMLIGGGQVGGWKFDKGVVGAKIKIWFDDVLIIDSLFGAGHWFPEISSIMFRDTWFHILQGNDSNARQDYLLEIAPIPIPKLATENGEKITDCRMCVDSLWGHYSPQNTIKLPINDDMLNNIAKGCAYKNSYYDYYGNTNLTSITTFNFLKAISKTTNDNDDKLYTKNYHLVRELFKQTAENILSKVVEDDFGWTLNNDFSKN